MLSDPLGEISLVTIIAQLSMRVPGRQACAHTHQADPHITQQAGQYSG